MANKTSPDPSAFGLPDGQPIAAELVEADLRGRVAKCEEALEDAVWKNLGLSLAGQGRLGEAAHGLLEADRRCPGDARARRHLAELLGEYPEILEADPALAAACRARGIRPGPVGSA
ncbi:MAG: hypothetical protein WCI75_16490 [candidate division NC10 bacterium]